MIDNIAGRRANFQKIKEAESNHPEVHRGSLAGSPDRLGTRMRPGESQGCSDGKWRRFIPALAGLPDEKIPA